MSLQLLQLVPEAFNKISKLVKLQLVKINLKIVLYQEYQVINVLKMVLFHKNKD